MPYLYIIIWKFRFEATQVPEDWILAHCCVRRPVCEGWKGHRFLKEYYRWRSWTTRLKSRGMECFLLSRMECFQKICYHQDQGFPRHCSFAAGKEVHQSDCCWIAPRIWVPWGKPLILVLYLRGCCLTYLQYTGKASHSRSEEFLHINYFWR